MKTRLLYTDGCGAFKETEFEIQEPNENQIQVRAVMTGVCRSDIDMMNGDFGILPLNMQGHEGIGQVVKLGSDSMHVKIGDYVATRGEPAYADFYNVNHKEFIVIPEAKPKYILEPIACGVNVVTQSLDTLRHKQGPGHRLLILGSGFLAWVAYNTLLYHNLNYDITVCGSHNQDLWKNKLSEKYEGTFDVIIDLSSKTDVFNLAIVNNESLIIFAAQKKVTTDFGNLLWKACTIVFPSPRTDKFEMAMHTAKDMIKKDIINVDTLWTKQYNRDTAWQDAFDDSNNRQGNFSRAYIYWDNNVRY